MINKTSPSFALHQIFLFSLIFVGFVVSTLLILAGVPYFEAIKVTGALLVQVGGGLLTWYLIYPHNQKNILFSLGAGSLLGVTLSTFSHQLFLSTKFESIAAYIPSVFAVFLFLKNSFFRKRLPVNADKLILPFSMRKLCFGFLFLTIIGLLDQWWWLTPVAISSCFWALTRISKINIFLGIAISFLSIFFSQILRKVNTVWWITSNDTPYLESLSISLHNFGPQGNISAVGRGISYHWFSLAWVGLTDSMSNASNWTVISLLLPIFCCLLIGVLTFSLVLRLTESQTSALLATIGTLMLSEVVGPSSPSQVFAFVSMLVVAQLFLDIVEQSKVFNSIVPLLIYFIFVTFGSKVSTGAVLASGLVLTSVFISWGSVKHRIILIGLVSVTTLGSYLYFFGSTRGINALKFGPSNLGGLKLMGRPLGGGALHHVIEIIALIIFFLPVLCGFIYFVTGGRLFKQSSFLSYLAISCLAGFAMGFLLDGVGTEAYFVYATFPFLIICVSIFSKSSVSFFLSSSRSKYLSTIVIFAFTLGVLRSSVSEMLTKRDIPSFGLSLLPFLFLYLVFGLVSVFSSNGQFSWVNRRLVFGLVFCLMLTASFVGENFSHRIVFARSAITEFANDERFKNQNYFAGSPSRIEALSWLRYNSPSDSVVATNRFCLSTTYCGPFKWFLASAISKRQMLIEGYYYSVGIYPEPDWAQKRIDVSERFGQQATASDFGYLKDEGVSYFIVDLEFVWSYETQTWETFEAVQLKSWEPYATTVFKNDEMAILKLN